MKNNIFKAFRHLLTPLVKLLLRSGITWQEFSELSKEVFVGVALRDYGLQGRPTNNARIALLTGLSRREVARVKKLVESYEPGPEPVNRISQVLTAWHMDPDFLEQTGKPALLSREGESRSIEALFHRYAGDIPHGALLKEMQKLGLIEDKGGKYSVLKRDYLRQSADPDMLKQAGITLHDHAMTVIHNLDSERAGLPRFERMATQTEVNLDTFETFQKLLDERGQLFLEEMDQWLHEHKATDQNSDERQKKTVRTGVGVFLVLEES